MKRYLLFAGSNHYPKGGWYDFIDSYDTLDESDEAYAKLGYNKYIGETIPPDWYHIVDTESMTIIERSESGVR